MTARAGDTYYLKQALRRELRARRLSVCASRRRQAAEAAARIGATLLCAARVRSVAVYLNCGSELPTQPLIRRLRAAGMRVAVPRITGDGRMRFEWLRASTPLRRNHHGIREPAQAGARVLRRQFDAIVLPLVGFDRYGNRLGSGGGYYDRFLARPRIGGRPHYLGYAYAAQQVEQLPRDAWDLRLDAVITEKGLSWRTG